MNRTYQTDRKLNREVLAPSGIRGSFDEQSADCPFVFYHRECWWMLYIGFDGKGYHTGLAKSRDLLGWEKTGMLFPDADLPNIAGVWILRENDLKGLPVLKKYQGKYWMVFHTYPGEGYEAGPAWIGLAWSTDEKLMKWHILPEPILKPEDGQAWEKGGLYKGCLVENGNIFYLFYNAKDGENWPWHEQIGLAVSRDLKTWERCAQNPLVRCGETATSPVSSADTTPVSSPVFSSWDSQFAADPFVVWDEGRWIMFYYGYDLEHARNGCAVSEDLLHWTKYPDPILEPGPPGSIDSRHAHKPCLIWQEQDGGGRLVHFYCAVREGRETDPFVRLDEDTGRSEYRCICVASNSELKDKIAG